MVLPLVLLFLAASASAIVAYGTHPAWAHYSHGFAFILLARRLEWPLATLAILLCLALIALVVAGKRRAWWLIGLGPILALFVHRYHTNPFHRFAILDNPTFLPASAASFLAPEDFVVGLTFEGNTYAYPYYAIYAAPVVFQQAHDKRMILIWNAFANRALAFYVNHELYPRDLQIVSMPANTLLLYNAKLGQFINGITGHTPDSLKPKGFSTLIPTRKLPWREWRAAHPSTLVMAPHAAASPSKIPSSPLRPLADSPQPDTIVSIIATTRPVAFLPSAVPEKPANITLANTPILIFREQPSQRLRVFDRRVEDLTLKFKPNTDTRRKFAALVDLDTDSGWTLDGRAVDGPLAKTGKRLTPIPTDEILWWNVMKKWIPELLLVDPLPILPETFAPPRPRTTRNPPTLRQRR